MSAHEPFDFHSADQLRERIRELSLRLEVSDDLSPLFQPLRIGAFDLPNRLVVLPMEGCDGLADGSPGELTFRRYRRFASGGASLLWFEATAVTGEGRANPRQLWIRDATLPLFARLVEAARAAAPGRPFLVLQQTHSGRYSRPGRSPQPIIAHHSPYLDPTHDLGADYPLITDEELERLEDVYVESARCARAAGFDAVDVKACHRYLISELHASHTREGRYGGSFENRTRLFRNIVEKIRDAVPGLVVTSRMNAYDAMAYPYGFGVDRADAGRPDLAEPIELVRFLRDMGSPLVNITIGNPYWNPHVNRPFDLPTAGSPIPEEDPLAGVERFTGVVRGIQEAFPGMAVIGGGYSWLRQWFPHVAAASIKNGWVSLAGMGRLAFAYPDAPRDLEQHGRLDPARVCVACSACTQIMRDGGNAGCVPRDAATYEPIYKEGRADALDTILAMARSCRQCSDPSCSAGCPAQVNIPEFVAHVAAGRFRAAYETLRQRNVLAAVCGYVCPAEIQCEAGCISRHYSEAVPIRHLQRWVGRKAVEEGWAAEERPAPPPSGKRVAVLGAGPAGISGASRLASLGHEVALFDRGAALGGLAEGTIPAERLPETVLHREVHDVLASSGVREYRQNVPLDAGYNLDHILEEGFDAVLVALGLGASVPLEDGGRPKAGVVGALEFLAGAKSGATVSGSVLVLGGGNTAIDAALAARSAGASDVSIVYRRSFAEMPAWPAQRDEALRSGIHFLILTAPLGYVADSSGALTGLRVIRTHLGAPGEDGRPRPEPIPGSEHVIPATLVVEAIGQRIEDALLEALPGLRVTARGLLWTGEGTLETNRPGVFAAGDIVSGGATVVQAVAEGARAAEEIDTRLRR